MKKLSRMTALMLALMLFITSLPITALAEITLDTSVWQGWVNSIKNAFQQAQNTTEAFSTTVDVPVTAQRVAQEYKTPAQYTTADSAITLLKGTTAKLTNVDGAGQWQFAIDEEHWVDIPGETGDSIILNERLLANGTATIRCGDGATVKVTLSNGNVLEDSAETITVAVTGERQVRTGMKFTAGDMGIGTLAEGDVKQTYNIVINYVFENNEIVSDPYTANLAEGSSFSATVTFPTVQGYLPYVGETQQNSIALNYASVTEDVTINVVYKPTNVNYTVIHYQQNVGDDKYTEKERETKQGLTASQVPEVAKTFEGFYNLIYERPNIAANGSTVIEVYYDRYYYLMNFDMDGGYGTEPVYARYGASLGKVNEPTKAGYTFVGWSETKGGTTAVTLPTTMPAANKTYYAIWKPDDTAKVTVVFWGENADDEKYSYLNGKTMTMDLAPGTVFTYSEGQMVICGKFTHEHTEACGYACGKEEHSHTIADGCYQLTCEQASHNHVNDGCTLSCTHTHTLDCYTAANDTNLKETTKPDKELTHAGNGIYTYDSWGKHYYLNIGSKWYCSDGWIGDRNSISLNCNHMHSDGCYTCGQTNSEHVHSIENGCYTLVCVQAEHVHSDVCGYNCGKEAHTHTSSCYKQGVGLESSLWKFKSSDTVTVAADGSTVLNVYYDRVEKTLTFKYSYSNNSYRKTETITAKWGQNIASQYTTIANNANSTFWTDKQNGNGPYTNYFGVMPQTSATYYNRGKNGSTGSMTYYGESLTDGDYSVKLFTTTNVGGYYVTEEDRYEFKGFTYHHGTDLDKNCAGATFYYTRNSYKLTFNDGYNDIKTETVKYEAPLGTYYFAPTVPEGKYEPGSVEFGGWYLNPECSDTANYDLSQHKMPASDLILYAKWVPVKHTVTFYLDKEAYDAGTKLDTHPAITVPHGELANPTPAEPTKGSYEFVGWFYMDNGTEKAFDFANMQVRKDLDVYGKWSSNTLKAYTVQYVLKDDHSVKVADDLTGSGLAGTTKTFEAKGGTELYADYQEGYFPTVQSQSLLLDIDKDTLTVTFEYVPMPAVPYTVKYVEKDTGKSLADDKVVSDNRKAVVTETFKPISGYMPDAYQKRLVVTADGENILYFYYSKDETHAYYKITHFTQNTDGKTFTEYASSQIVGEIGETYNAGTPLTIPGFAYKEGYSDDAGNEEVKSGKLTENGLELKLYYVRNEYPYQVRYLEQGSGNVLHDPKNGTGKYGQVISESAIDIDGYDKVDPTSAELNIRIDEGEGAPKLNIITFYYKEQEVTINYKVVGPEGCGTVATPSDLTPSRETSETVKVKSGEAKGATATANEPTYKFVGWYKDEACTKAVDTAWVVDNKITPQKSKTIDEDEKTEKVYEAATYYAKFEYNLTTLTIKKEGSEVQANETFIFDVKKGNDVIATVTITGKGSVTIGNLTVGDTITVSERGSWSNRYASTTYANNGIKLKPDPDNSGVNTITVTNSSRNDQWLHDESAIVNFTQSGND